MTRNYTSADLEAAATADEILDVHLSDDEYSAFATYCDNHFGAGPTAMIEDDPQQLLETLQQWIAARVSH